MGILLLLMSFVSSFVQYSEGLRKRWARCAVIGGFALPIGILLEAPYGVVGSVVADLSGLAMVVCVIAMLFGLLRHMGGSDISKGEVA